MLISKRNSISLLFIVLSLVLAIWSHQYNTRFSFRQIETYSMDQINFSMSHLQMTVEQALRRNLKQWVRQELVTLGLDPDHKTLVLVDNRGQIISSKSPSQIGRFANNELSKQVGSLDLEEITTRINYAKYTLLGDTELHANGTLISAIYPVRLGVLKGEIRPYRIGYLFLLHDLSDKKATARKHINQQITLLFTIVTLLMAGVNLFYFLFTGKKKKRRIQELEGIIQTLKPTSTPHFKNIFTSDDELYPLAETLEEMSQRLSEKYEEQTRLIENLKMQNLELDQYAIVVGSALKTPISTINQYLNDMERDLSKGEIEVLHDEVFRIHKIIEKMQQILEEMYSLARAGLVMSQPTNVSLRAVAYEVMEILSRDIKEKEVRVEIAPNLPNLYADKVLLLELLRNLIENSILYMGDQKEPFIEIGVRESAEGDDVFFVRDNGKGIPLEDQKRIFEPFERLDQTTDRSGFGLFLAKKIIEEHKGSIWVESQGEGKGSQFNFTFPTKKELKQLSDPREQDTFSNVTQ